MINIIVAFTSKGFGIGKNNTIPWNIPEDLKHFQDVTKHSIVVMGHNTYLSIPEKNRPLPDRFNIVITSMPLKYTSNTHVVFATIEEIDSFLDSYNDTDNIYIIGGASIYQKYVGIADNIIATIIDKDIECDTLFPVENFGFYEIDSYSPIKFSETEKCNYRIVKYKKTIRMHNEYEYLNLLDQVMQYGEERPDRTGIGTKSIFAPDDLRFDISKMIPLYTTKFVGIKMVIKELLWFIRGQTDSKLLEEQGVNIWKCNTSREFLDNRNLQHYKEGDLGPLYGINFRSFNAEYKGCNIDHKGQGVDQLMNLINGLKNDPYSRRHIITTFNPATVDQCVLYPCHGLTIMMYVDSNRRLSCKVMIRSNDLLLGNPVNVTSYAIFTHIIAKMVDMTPKELIISIGDAHIYMNHLEQVKTLLKRKPLPFPILEINDDIKNKRLEDITIDDFNLVGYLYHPAIKAPMAI